MKTASVIVQQNIQNKHTRKMHMNFTKYTLLIRPMKAQTRWNALKVLFRGVKRAALSLLSKRSGIFRKALSTLKEIWPLRFLLHSAHMLWVWATECAASLPLTAQNRRWERLHCAGTVRPHAHGAVLETSSNWTKVYPKKSLGLSVCTFYGKKALKGSESC